MLHPTLRSKEATPSSDKEASSGVTAHCTQEGIKGGNKRRKQCLQGTISTISHDDTLLNMHGINGMNNLELFPIE
jgi:hypothetical protein